MPASGESSVCVNGLGASSWTQTGCVVSAPGGSEHLKLPPTEAGTVCSPKKPSSSGRPA